MLIYVEGLTFIFFSNPTRYEVMFYTWIVLNKGRKDVKINK